MGQAPMVNVFHGMLDEIDRVGVDQVS